MKATIQDNLFGSEDEGQSLEPAPQEPEEDILSEEEDDLRDFIEEIDEQGRPVTRKRSKFSNNQMTEAQEVFGDFDLENFDERQEQIERPRPLKLSEIYDPDELAERYFTPQDEEIRVTDLPEREQVQFFPKRLPPVENEIKEEAEWIF